MWSLVAVARSIGGGVYAVCVWGEEREMPVFFFFQAEDGIRDVAVTGVQTCALPIFPQTLEELKSGKDQEGKEIGFSLGATKDPWNNEYIYEVDSSGRPHARCLGKDRKSVV